MKKKKTLTYPEHLEIAARVKEARKLLQQILVRVDNGLGSSSKAAKLAYQVFEKFDRGLRCELDEVLFRDCRDKADSDELMAVYYGPTADSKVVLHRNRASD